jgi:hypothetical protein
MLAHAADRDALLAAGDLTGVSAAAARCTSSRVIEPSGPLPASAARLMPRSLASLRTGGLASVGLDWVGSDWVRAAGSAATSGGSTGTWDVVGTSAVSGRPAAAATAGDVLRTRRMVDDVLTP